MLLDVSVIFLQHRNRGECLFLAYVQRKGIKHPQTCKKVVIGNLCGFKLSSAVYSDSHTCPFIIFARLLRKRFKVMKIVSVLMRCRKEKLKQSSFYFCLHLLILRINISIKRHRRPASFLTLYQKDINITTLKEICSLVKE